MNPLDSPVRAEASDDGRWWTLLHPVVYVTDDGRRIEVPTGYRTDFASVPRCLWWLLPPTGRYLYAALIHDRLYDLHRAGQAIYDRAYADGILREAMRASGVPRWQRWAIYTGVRLGGSAYWNRKA